jgi:hypothetical protein
MVSAGEPQSSSTVMTAEIIYSASETVCRGGGPDLARKKAVVVSLRTVELSRAISQIT